MRIYDFIRETNKRIKFYRSVFFSTFSIFEEVRLPSEQKCLFVSEDVHFALQTSDLGLVVIHHQGTTLQPADLTLGCVQTGKRHCYFDVYFLMKKRYNILIVFNCGL